MYYYKSHYKLALKNLIKPLDFNVVSSITDDLDVSAPLEKKHFSGGLYAAHCIKMGDFHEWEWLCKWAENNTDYTPKYSDKGEEIMGGCLEEHLNFLFNIKNDNKKWPGNDSQIDLLLPIKLK